jgi:hypothetical protein
MVIIPNQSHIRKEVSSRAGNPWTRTVRASEIQGLVVTGIQGTGAPAAAMTAGLVGAEHIPKGKIFSKGTQSIIFPMSINSALTVRPSINNGVGAVPKEHLMREM